jgi:murein DD-endopeptidase MepM/ murein hydrolase activator NlpD
MADGVVTNVGTDPSGGNVVNIKHNNNIRTYSAHLGTITVHKGDKVTVDTQIGTVGDSGNAKGTMPHVHFQVWQNQALQNPNKYFSIPKYTNVDPKKEQAWLGDQYKQEAQRFNVSQHNAKAKQAFSKQIERLVKKLQKYSAI